MNFLELVESRWSVRKYDNRPVEQKKIDMILRAGHLAPTACNKQPQKIYILQSKKALQKLKKCTECEFNAPIAMLICYDRDICWQRMYDNQISGDIDASIVSTHMMIEATELGIGSCWVMHFRPEAIRREFMLPENINPICILYMGYPAEDAAPTPSHSTFREATEVIEYM